MTKKIERGEAEIMRSVDDAGEVNGWDVIVRNSDDEEIFTCWAGTREAAVAAAAEACGFLGCEVEI